MSTATIRLRVTSDDQQQQPLSAPTATTVCTDFLSPHSLPTRNSISSASDNSMRRRRPITLKIMPRLSLPCRSTSAPASTTEIDWTSAVRRKSCAAMTYKITR